MRGRDSAAARRPADRPRSESIKRLWLRHSIAEDRRDIDGLIATLAPECAYEIVGTGFRWDGHDGARAFYTELFGAFPDNRFALADIVIGPQGVFESVVLEATHAGPFAGLAPTGRRRPTRAGHPVSLGSRDAAVHGRADLHRSSGAGHGLTGTNQEEAWACRRR